MSDLNGILMARKIFITGATGLIGRELAAPLAAAGFDVYATTSQERRTENGYTWLRLNVFDHAGIRDALRAIRPQYLLNLAWAATGDYLTNPVNYDFLSAGVNLARCFADCGGERAVYAGTCFEYAFRNEPLKETDPLDPDRTDYTFCKNKLREIARRLFAKAGVGFGYGRIFYVYGRNEHPARLTPTLIRRLSAGERVNITAGPLVKDYLYTKDIAAAFVRLVDSHVEGPVNICGGRGITIRDYALAIARRLGREDLLDFADETAGQPPVIVGDNTRLVQEAGFTPRYTLNSALDEILSAEDDR